MGQDRFYLQGGEVFVKTKENAAYQVFRTSENGKILLLEAISSAGKSFFGLQEASRKEWLDTVRVLQIGKRSLVSFSLSNNLVDLINGYLKKGGRLALILADGNLYLYFDTAGQKKILRANPKSWKLIEGNHTSMGNAIAIPFYPLTEKAIFTYGAEGYHQIEINQKHFIYVLGTHVPLDIEKKAKNLAATKSVIDNSNKAVPFKKSQLKSLRKLWGLSVRDVENKTNVPKSSVSHFENQKDSIVHKSTILALANGLSLVSEELIEPNRKEVEIDG